MTQRTKYRTGRRSSHRKGGKATPVVQEQSLSVHEESHPQELMTMNEKTPELEQVETKVSEEISQDSEILQSAEQVETAVEETVATMSETEVSEEVKNSKGGFGKVVLGGVILASLAGGGYYYAQQNNLFGLGMAPNTSDAAVAETAATSAEAVSTPAVPEVVPTEEKTATDSGVTDATPVADTATKENTSADVTSAAPTDATSSENGTESTFVDTLNKEVADSMKKTEESVKAIAEDIVAATSTEQAVEQSTENSATDNATEVNKVESAESTSQEPSSAAQTSPVEAAVASTSALEARLAAQEQQITQLVAQLKEAQSQAAVQQAKEQKLLSHRAVLNELSGLFQAADFERSVRASKENALKALTVLNAQLALQQDTLWDNVRQAVDKDIQTLTEAADINLDKLFKATNELAELVKTAPFISAEGAQSTVTTPTTSSATASSTSTTEGSWLDQAINHVERLPVQAYEAIRSDLGGLITVEKLSNPAASTLSVSEIQAQRAETLRQLSIAQEALLKREESVWKAATQKVEQQLMTYYNINFEKTQQAVALARQLMETSVKSNLPALSNTQQALEQFARQLRIEN